MNLQKDQDAVDEVIKDFLSKIPFLDKKQWRLLNEKIIEIDNPNVLRYCLENGYKIDSFLNTGRSASDINNANYLFKDKNIKVIEEKEKWVKSLIFSISNAHYKHQFFPEGRQGEDRLLLLMRLIKKYNLFHNLSQENLLKNEEIIFGPHNKNSLEILFEMGISPNIKNKEGDNLFGYVNVDNLEAIKYLKEKGCDVLNINQRGSLSFESFIDRKISSINIKDISKYLELLLNNVNREQLDNLYKNENNRFISTILNAISKKIYISPKELIEEYENEIEKIIKVFDNKNYDFSVHFLEKNNNEYVYLLEKHVPLLFSKLIKYGIKKEKVYVEKDSLTWAEQAIETDLLELINKNWNLNVYDVTKNSKSLHNYIFGDENIGFSKLINSNYIKNYIHDCRKNDDFLSITKLFLSIKKPKIFNILLNEYPEFYNEINEKIKEGKNKVIDFSDPYIEKNAINEFFLKLPSNLCNKEFLKEFFDNIIFNKRIANTIKEKHYDELVSFLKNNTNYYYSNNIVKKSFGNALELRKGEENAISEFTRFMKEMDLNINPLGKNTKGKDIYKEHLKDDLILELVIDYFKKPDKMFQNLFHGQQGIQMTLEVLKNINKVDENGYKLFDYIYFLSQVECFKNYEKIKYPLIGKHGFMSFIEKMYNNHYNFSNSDLKRIKENTKDIETDQFLISLIEKKCLMDIFINNEQNNEQKQEKIPTISKIKITSI